MKQGVERRRATAVGEAEGIFSVAATYNLMEAGAESSKVLAYVVPMLVR